MIDGTIVDAFEYVNLASCGLSRGSVWQCSRDRALLTQFGLCQAASVQAQVTRSVRRHPLTHETTRLVSRGRHEVSIKQRTDAQIDSPGQVPQPNGILTISAMMTELILTGSTLCIRTDLRNPPAASDVVLSTRFQSYQLSSLVRACCLYGLP